MRDLFQFLKRAFAPPWVMINLSGTDSIIECMHGESLPEDVVRMYCYIQVDVCNGCNIDGSGAGFVSPDVLLHSGLNILVFVFAVVMMVVMLVILFMLFMIFRCFYM